MKKGIEIIIDLGEREMKREMKRFYKIQDFLFSTTLHGQEKKRITLFLFGVSGTLLEI